MGSVTGTLTFPLRGAFVRRRKITDQRIQSTNAMSSGPNHELATISGIIDKWSRFTDQWGGMFVRYVDGNPMNGAASNVVCVSPRETFAHLNDSDWVVNWPQCLDAAEVQFVLDNGAKIASVFGRRA